MPLFSTIIPTYNRADLLPAALESVFGQDFSDQEVIVVDDGSTDETAAVLARYADRIRVLRQPNLGPGAARNLGIRHATGRYIAFLDSDDLWFPWTLATYAAAIRRNDNPAFLAGTEVQFSDPAELSSVSCSEAGIDVYTDYLAAASRSVWIGTCGAAVRADVIRDVGAFHSEWINAEDSDLWLRLGTAPGFAHIASPPVFAYRRHPGSAVSNLERTCRGIWHLIGQESANRYPGGSRRRRERLTILTRHARPVALGCLRQQQILEAWRLYRGTLSWNLRLGRWRYLLGFWYYFLRSYVNSWRVARIAPA